MNILGISCFYHDSAACLIKDGKILSAVQEERFTRKKHDQNFPNKSIEFCLEENGLAISDVDFIVFYDKPFLKFERILENFLFCVPFGLNLYMRAIQVWIKTKLWIPNIIYKETGYKGKILFTEHHQSHAASAFYPSPFKEAAFLVVDGVGEWATTSFGVGVNNKIDIMSEIKFPHSLGLLYSAFTYYLGFKVNSGEYKVMGLAPYGNPIYVDKIYNNLVDVKDDGSFALNMDYFNYQKGLTMTNKKFHSLFGGGPRNPETKISQREMDIARSIQQVTEDIMLKIVKHIHKETGKKFLCLAGGVSLNCVANGKILREGPFDDIWIQPASGDAGGVLGAALYVWYQYLNNKRFSNEKTDFQGGSYLGPEYSNDEIRKRLDLLDANYVFAADDDALCENIASLINKGNVIGWFQGKMEFGPRALGNRSILGDPRSPNMQTNMNLKIKFRESFRPFAPSVLEEKADDYFVTKRGQHSPYMLLTTDVRGDKIVSGEKNYETLEGFDKLKSNRSVIPAVTHVDYSARVQTVSKNTNPKYHKLIEKFYFISGCPLVINTSFNVRGEPIVCTPEDAFTCFMRTGMDYLVVGNYILCKEKQKSFNDKIDWRKKYELD